MQLLRASSVVLVLLWLAVIGTAMSVVYTTHKTRMATQTLEVLKNEAAALQIETGQYLLERSTLSTYARIEQMAISNLDMAVPDSEQIVIVEQ